ncbi:hypothetical protein DFH09DRAFT_1336947 [Mycena vulgaris]|nr:hypothetical protein DFH09DRAFT_1336947 [Mycena vulgaris]
MTDIATISDRPSPSLPHGATAMMLEHPTTCVALLVPVALDCRASQIKAYGATLCCTAIPFPAPVTLIAAALGGELDEDVADADTDATAYTDPDTDLLPDTLADDNVVPFVPPGSVYSVTEFSDSVICVLGFASVSVGVTVRSSPAWTKRSALGTFQYVLAL